MITPSPAAPGPEPSSEVTSTGIKTPKHLLLLDISLQARTSLLCGWRNTGSCLPLGSDTGAGKHQVSPRCYDV